MRRLAQIIVGSLALGLMVLRQPWNLRECPSGTCTYTSDETLAWVIFGAACYVLFLGVIVTVVLVGVLGMRDTGRASDSAVLAALGQSQRSAVRVAAVRGLKDGAVVTGVAYLAAAALNVWIVVTTGYGLAGLNPLDFVARLVFAVGFTGILVLAHVIDAVRPRRTPVERLHEDAAPPRARRVRLRLRALALLALGAASAGVLCGVAVSHDPTTGYAGTVPALLGQAALIGIGVTSLALFFLVGVPLARMVIPGAVRAAARGADAMGAGRASALLQARAATSSRSSSRTVLAISALALLAGVLCIQTAPPLLAPTYVGTVQILPASAGPEVAEQYRDLPGVGTVIALKQYGEWPSAVAVKADDVADVDPTLARLLREYPSALILGGGDGSPLNGLSDQGIHVNSAVTLGTCCMAFTSPANVSGDLYSAGLMVYAEPGADLAAVSAAVQAHTVNDVPSVTGYGGSFPSASGAQTDFWGALFLFALVAVICGGPVIALAAGVSMTRRREDATLGALGASRNSLTGVAVVETSVISTVALGAGLLSGAALQSVFSVAARANDSLNGIITDSYLDVLLHSVAWAPLLMIWGGTVSVFALVAWIVSSLGAKRLPAEQLRAAEIGVLS